MRCVQMSSAAAPLEIVRSEYAPEASGKCMHRELSPRRSSALFGNCAYWQCEWNVNAKSDVFLIGVKAGVASEV